MNLKQKARQLKTDIPAIYLVLKDKETPSFAKLMAGITGGYALSPIDLIPDFVPVLGYLDDVILLPIMIALTIHFIPKDVWERSRKAAYDMWKDGKPKKWYYAIPVLCIWLLIIIMFIRAII